MVIERFVKWINSNNNIPRYMTRVILQLNNLKEFCVEFPTCEGCPFYKHQGRKPTTLEWWDECRLID